MSSALLNLKKGTPRQVNYATLGTRVFSALATQLASIGGVDDRSMAVVPDGSGELLPAFRSGDNANMSFDISPVVQNYVRPTFAIYLDDFLDATTNLPVSDASFNQVECWITVARNGGLTGSHIYKMVLNRGWNTIAVGRGIENLPSRAGVLTVSPSGVGGNGHMTDASTGVAVSLPVPFTIPVWDNGVDRIRIRVAGVGSGRKTRIFLREMVDDAVYDSETIPIFDDGTDDFFRYVFPMLKDLDLVASVAVIGEKVGQSGFMTRDQLKEVQDYGCMLLNHSWDHLFADQTAVFTVSEAQAKLDRNRDFMIANGLNWKDSASIYVAPYGRFQQMNCANERASLISGGYKMSFGTTNRLIAGQILSPHFLPRMNYNVRDDQTGFTNAELIRQLRQAFGNGLSAPLMLHKFVPGAASNDTELNIQDGLTMLRMLKEESEAGHTKVVTPDVFLKDSYSDTRSLMASGF